MASLSRKNSHLFCPVRKAPVPALPEECIRVQLLCDLIKRLEFPLSALSVEKELSQIPHLRSIERLPKRRIDILCYAKGIHPTEEFFPLIIFECKAVKLTDAMLRQVIGYNHFIKAPYIALLNDKELRLGWYDHVAGAYRFVSHLPTYQQLIDNFFHH